MKTQKWSQIKLKIFQMRDFLFSFFIHDFDLKCTNAKETI